MNVGQTIVRRYLIGGPAWSAFPAAAILWLILPFQAEPAAAAEIRLRPQCHSRGALVTLGDVAQITAVDQRRADALAAVELFAPPAVTRQRFVHARQIQDVLRMRGINLAEHRFSGSSQVAILGDGGPVPTKRERPLPYSAVRRANDRVREAVVGYLQANVAADVPFSVQLELDPSRARLVSGPESAISLGGGVAPWTGLQRFEATVDTPDGPVRFPLDVQVAVPAAVVVAVRSLPRGAIIRALDVKLQHDVSPQERSQPIYSLQEVIGKETTCAIPQGKILLKKSVRAPLLVRRGEVVTVYARSPGVRVRTTGRVRDSGSLGELVSVESLLNRQTYYARVSAVREVEVYAGAVRVETDTGRASGAVGSRGGITSPNPRRRRPAVGEIQDRTGRGVGRKSHQLSLANSNMMGLSSHPAY